MAAVLYERAGPLSPCGRRRRTLEIVWGTEPEYNDFNGDERVERSGAGERQLKDSRRIEALRAKYRSLWDAHQVIADHNARLVQSGTHPSNEQLINEQKAAEAVALARAELLAALAKRAS